MRFWMVIAAVSGTAASLLCWQIPWFRPLSPLRFTPTETLLIGIGTFAAIVAVAALMRTERNQTRQSLTVRGLEQFETDLARRLGAIEARLEGMMRSPDDSDQPLQIPKFSQMLSVAGAGRDGENPAADPTRRSAAVDIRSHDPEYGEYRQRFLALIDEGGIVAWYQPVVALPERTTRFLDAEPYLAPPGEEPLASAEWMAIAEREGMLSDIAASTIAQSIRFARELQCSDRDCGVIAALPPMALTGPAEVRSIDNALRANAGISSRIVLKIPYEAFRQASNSGRDMLDRYRSDGYRLALFGCRDLRLAGNAVESGLFAFLLIAAELYFAPGPRGDASALARLRHLQGEAVTQMIATGIHTEEMAIELIDNDILLAQGGLFSPARPPRRRNDEFELSRNPGARY